MKKIVVTLLAAVLLLSLSLPSVAIGKTEWQGLKDVAELVKSISLNELSGEAAEAITEGLSKKYGYEIVNEVSFTKDGRFFVGWEVPEEYKDDDVQWDVLYYACDHLVTKEQILTVMKELYPMLTDELAEEIFNLPTDPDYGYWYVKTDPGYVVGQIPLGGGPYHVYAGYTEENNNYHFYYAYTHDAIKLNAPSLEYNGKTYYSTQCYYEPVIDSDDYWDLYKPLNEIEFNGKTYYRAGNDFSASYYTLPENEQDLAELAKKTNEPGLFCYSIQYNEKTYYEYPDGFYASSGYMEERNDNDEKLEESVIYINDKYYFYYDGGYYGFPQYNADPVWKNVKLDITKVPTVEANGLTYVMKYSNSSSDYSTKDGEILSEAKEFISSYDGERYTSCPETIAYNGVTYFDSYYGYITNADFGKEIVLKVKNGKAVSLSSSEVKKFPENMNTEYADSQSENGGSSSNGVAYNMPKGVIVSGDSSFPAGTTVTAKTVESGTVFDIAKKALAGISNKFVVFDFSAVKDGLSVQPNGKVKVTFDIPESLSLENLKMFYISDSGEKQEIAITVDKANKTVTAELEHFSTYVLANVSTSPKTGDGTDFTLLSLLTIISLVGMIFTCYKLKTVKANG